MAALKVCVIGLGYIGLPTAVVLAHAGMEVVGVDTNPEVVRAVQEGRAHIAEPDCDRRVRSAVALGGLRAVSAPETADVYLIAVPTPFKEDHRPDLSSIEAAARSIAPQLRPGNLVILESTSPVGTTENLARLLFTMRQDLSFSEDSGDDPAHVHVAYCPERVLLGRAFEELIRNDRIMGGVGSCCGERAVEFFARFVEGQCHITNSRTAEMVKLAENAFRDVNVAFANELSLICERLDINVWELVKLANHHPRVNILRPGPGVGGHCVAVDPWFLVDAAPELARLIRASRAVNDDKISWVVERVMASIGDDPGATVACLGLTFKADVDDLRESPALKIVQSIAEIHRGPLQVVDPYVRDLPQELAVFPHARLADLSTVFEEADIVVGLVDHREFKTHSPWQGRVKAVIDTRGMWGGRAISRAKESFPACSS